METSSWYQSLHSSLLSILASVFLLPPQIRYGKKKIALGLRASACKKTECMNESKNAQGRLNLNVQARVYFGHDLEWPLLPLIYPGRKSHRKHILHALGWRERVAMELAFAFTDIFGQRR